jgi:hypothetical protein
MKRRDFIRLGVAAAFVCNFAAGQEIALKSGPGDRTYIYVDPRIEMFSVVLYLSDFKGLKNEDGAIEARVVTELDFAYRRDVDKRFSSYKGHEAVKLYSEMATKGLFRFGHPPSVMLHLSDPPQLQERIPIDDFLVKMAGSREKLSDFIRGMRQFAKDTDFMAFFGNHKKTYQKIAENYRDNMGWNYVKDLEEYYGERQTRYNLILAPLFHPGGFGPRMKTPDGQYAAYAIIGPKGVTDDLPNFGSGDSMRRLCWHEFSHSFVNHLVDSNLERLREPMGILESRKLPPQVIERIKNLGIWDVHISDQTSEYVVRAVTTRLAFNKLGPEQGRGALELEKSEGYPHIDVICQCLEQYEKQRGKYPTLKDYFPQIVSVFAGLAEKTRGLQNGGRSKLTH